MTKTLLPTGCYDLLPPHARQESGLSHALLSVFEANGYEQVSPPLLEYTESLLAGRGAALSSQIFRMMDPGAHKVMGIRADITLQIARIAGSRMKNALRPLRLCYNGLILRMEGEALRSDRQLRQAGIELIGAASPEADAEVILVAAEALAKAGMTKLSIDLNLPGIVSALLAAEKLSNEEVQTIFEAVAHKDVSTLRSLTFAYRESLIALLQCAGPAEFALAAIHRLDLPEVARKQCRELQEVIDILNACSNSQWTLTIDATENRGLSYHSGISFSIFVAGAACEVGRGGRYRIENPRGGSEAVSQAYEEATGFTLYVETLRGLLTEPERGKRVFIVGGIADKTAKELQAQGYITVRAISEYGSDEEEAKRLGCEWIYEKGKIKIIDDKIIDNKI